MINTLLNNYKILGPVLVLVAALFFQDILKSYYRNDLSLGDNVNKEFSNEDRIFTAERLSRYNGIIEEKLYVAVLGFVFDVSKSRQHYAKGASYHYFVGKDGSRGLITGDFKDESDNKDHVLDLSCNDLFSLINWRDTFEKKYELKGMLIGKYFDSEGGTPPYKIVFEENLRSCYAEKDATRRQDLQYPPCNIAWSENEGTKVWCTKTSGGVPRDWVGVPRQLYKPGNVNPTCVCMNTDQEQNSNVKFKEYENCSNTSDVCYIGVG